METRLILGETTLSPCGRYRYLLSRDWRMAHQAENVCLFVMLNPSTGDALQDDPTLRRCIGFAQREGHTSLEVVNLFAWRSPNPKVLSEDWVRSIGPENDGYIIRAAQRANCIIAAWGTNKTMGRDNSVLRILRRYRDVLCLRTTKAGLPEHPLYLPDSTPLKLFIKKDKQDAKPQSQTPEGPASQEIQETERELTTQRKAN